jgi:hypothetical protein
MMAVSDGYMQAESDGTFAGWIVEVKGSRG